MTNVQEPALGVTVNESPHLLRHYVVVLAALLAASTIALVLPSPTGQRAVLVNLSSWDEDGIAVKADYRSNEPLRVMGASLEDPTGPLTDYGIIWDDDVPDPEVGFDFVDIGGLKEVKLTFTFTPDCSLAHHTEKLTVTANTDEGDRPAPLVTPGLDQIVHDWCAQVPQAYITDRGVTGDSGLVSTDWLVTMPPGKSATFRLLSPGWQAEPFMMGTGTQQALITVTSEHPCDLGFDPIKFEVEYSDGRSGLVRARPDLSEVC